ncbi:MAG: CoA ester lyase [Desulfotignum sp.]|nr:CoA ester lyase [Desulfotignum sp.]
MEKPFKGPWVMRTFLFVPGHIEKYLQKASQSEADCVALCLEDAVPLEEKENARKTIGKVLRSGAFENIPVFVRINSMDTGMTLKDLESVACKELDGFVYPMAYTPDDIKSFDAQLSLVENQLSLEKGHFSIVVLIETPLAVLKAYEIATASKRVVALLFGCEDYMAEMESRYSIEERSLFTPRNMIAMAARAAGVEPLDTPYVKVHDLEGLKRFATLGRDLGMSGMLVMSPRQIEVARKCYTPSEDEIETATEIVTAAEEARKEGRGIVIVKGNFVSPPTLKQARKVLDRYADIQKVEQG